MRHDGQLARQLDQLPYATQNQDALGEQPAPRAVHVDVAREAEGAREGDEAELAAGGQGAAGVQFGEGEGGGGKGCLMVAPGVVGYAAAVGE